MTKLASYTLPWSCGTIQIVGIQHTNYWNVKSSREWLKRERESAQRNNICSNGCKMTYTTDLKIRQEVSDNCSKLNEWRQRNWTMDSDDLLGNNTSHFHKMFTVGVGFLLHVPKEIILISSHLPTAPERISQWPICQVPRWQEKKSVSYRT